MRNASRLNRSPSPRLVPWSTMQEGRRRSAPRLRPRPRSPPRRQPPRQAEAQAKAEAEHAAAVATAEAGRTAEAIAEAEGEYMGRGRGCGQVRGGRQGGERREGQGHRGCQDQGARGGQGRARPPSGGEQGGARVEDARSAAFQTLLLGAEAKAKSLAAPKQPSPPRKRPPRWLPRREPRAAGAALKQPSRAIKRPSRREEGSIIARTTANHAAEAKIALDMFSATDKEGFAPCRLEATNAGARGRPRCLVEGAALIKATAEKDADPSISAKAAAEKALEGGALLRLKKRPVSPSPPGGGGGRPPRKRPPPPSSPPRKKRRASRPRRRRGREEGEEEAEAAEKKARAEKLEEMKQKAAEDPDTAYNEIDMMVRQGDATVKIGRRPSARRTRSSGAPSRRRPLWRPPSPGESDQARYPRARR